MGTTGLLPMIFLQNCWGMRACGVWRRVNPPPHTCVACREAYAVQNRKRIRAANISCRYELHVRVATSRLCWVSNHYRVRLAIRDHSATWGLPFVQSYPDASPRHVMFSADHVLMLVCGSTIVLTYRAQHVGACVIQISLRWRSSLLLLVSGASIVFSVLQMVARMQHVANHH